MMLTDAKNKALFHNGVVLILSVFILFSCTERRRREAISAATCLTEALVDHLNVGYDGGLFCFCFLLFIVLKAWRL